MASETKTVATNHSGWTSGDGRTYDNNTCRSESGDWNPYYVYTYGFSIPPGSNIDGIKVECHTAGYEQTQRVQLCDSTTPQGTGKNHVNGSVTGSCANCEYHSHGGPTDKWGLSQAAINTLLGSANFGASIQIQSDLYADDGYLDGFQITVYYTEPQATRRSQVATTAVADVTRRASVSVVALKGEERSLSKEVATTHSGWDSGDGRTYNDATCRQNELNQDEFYFAYGYGFVIPNVASCRILGVQLETHIASTMTSVTPSLWLYLAEGTTQKGTHTTLYAPTNTNCSTAVYKTHGNSRWQYYMTQSNFNALVKSANFGFGARSDFFGSPGYYIYLDGVKITVWLDDPDCSRRASVNTAVTKEETRRSEVLVCFVGDTTRRSQLIHCGVGNVTRRSTLEVATTGQETRRSSLNTAVTKEETREATLNTATTDDLTRRADLNVAITKETTRRAELYADLSIVRRSQLFVYHEWFIESETRRAQVFVPWYNVRRSEVTVATTDEDRRRAILSVSTNESWRRSKVYVWSSWFLESETRRAQVNVARIKGSGPYSSIKNTATEQSGWSSGDGRIYDNDVCRTGSGYYYVWGYGFGIPPGARVDGVRVEHHFGYDHMFAPDIDVQLCESTTLKGTKKTFSATPQVFNCAGCNYHDHGGSTDKWGMTQSELNTLLQNSSFGVSVENSTVEDQWEDGFRVTVYYDDTDTTRRAQVTACEVGDVVRRAEVLAAFEENKTRRSVITVATSKDETRRSVLDVFYGHWVETLTRRAEVFVPWSNVRRSEVTVAIVDTDKRRSLVSVSSSESWRRAKVYVWSQWWIESEVRRSQLNVAVTKEETRRAQVFVRFEGDVVRRANILVAEGNDETRRSEITAAVGGEAYRRAIVDVDYVHYLTIKTRRATINVYKEYTVDSTRRAQVEARLEGNVTRRSEVVAAVSKDATRRSSLGVVVLEDYLKRAATVLVAAPPPTSEDEARRAILTHMAGAEITRNARVYVGGHNTIHDTRRARVYVSTRVRPRLRVRLYSR